jgi:hypothetical protein
MWLLLIPPAALLLTVLWTALRGRPRRVREAMITIDGYRRGLDALARPVRSTSASPVHSSPVSRASGDAGSKAADAGACPPNVVPRPSAGSPEISAVYPGDGPRGSDAESQRTAAAGAPTGPDQPGAAVPVARADARTTPPVAGAVDAQERPSARSAG